MGINHLDEIVAQTKAKGKYEEPWFILDNAFFKGDDCFDQLKQWAVSQGLTVTTDSRLQTYIFRVIRDLPK